MKIECSGKTESLLKINSLLPILASLVVYIFSSCSTDKDVSPVGSRETASIIVNVSAPAEPGTKADSGYKLRYIAQIFKGKTVNSWESQPVSRQEIIEGGSDGNQVVFKVDPNEYYIITVFADYIPAGATADAEGRYPDYFYNTTNAKKVIVNTTPGSTSGKVSAEFFNNDNYDCFFVKQEGIYKEAEEYRLSLTLKRAVAKVVLRDKTSNTGDYSVKVNSLGNRTEFRFETQTTVSGAEISIDTPLVQIAGITPDSRDLFYFYTPAALVEGNNEKVSISFSAGSEENWLTNTVKDIPVKGNYKTIVTGTFLPDPLEEKPGDDDNPTKEGDIILDLSTDYEWAQTPLEN